MGATWGTLKDRVASRAHKVLTRTLEDTDVEQWCMGGVEMVESEEPWNHLRTAETITLVGGTYEYAWPTYLARFVTASFRYGGSGTELTYARRPEHIDTRLNPDWRTGGDTGTPLYFVEFGTNFWIAPVPSTAFVTSNGTIYYYGWKTDLYTINEGAADDDALLYPLRMVELYTVASLIAGLQQEDDPDWRQFEGYYNRLLNKYIGFDESIEVDEGIEPPDFAYGMRY